MIFVVVVVVVDGWPSCVPYLPQFTLDNEDSCGGASDSGTSTVGATLFCQTCLGFEFDLGLTGSSFLNLFFFLVQRFKVNH